MRLVPFDRDHRRAVAASTAIAAILSGAPSTAHAVLTRRDPLVATRAAASLVGVGPQHRILALAGGGVVHLVVSAWWGTVLGAVLPPGRRTRWGVVAGVAIFVLDLQVIARLAKRPAITALPPSPQLADHLAFAVVIGFVLDRFDERPPRRAVGDPGTRPPSGPTVWELTFKPTRLIPEDASGPVGAGGEWIVRVDLARRPAGEPRHVGIRARDPHAASKTGVRGGRTRPHVATSAGTTSPDVAIDCNSYPPATPQRAVRHDALRRRQSAAPRSVGANRKPHTPQGGSL